MSVRLPGVNNELAAAVRRINALRAGLPDAYRPVLSVERWRQLEAQLDRTCSAGDVESALAAVEAWAAEESRKLSDVLLNAPLEKVA